MMLTPDNEKLLLYTHWFRLVRPEHIAELGLNDLEYLYKRMPKLAKEGYLERVTWRRERMKDIYAAYQLGLKGRDVLRDTFGISKDKTRFKTTPKQDNTRWIHHTLMTTDIAVALCSALGEQFTPLDVVSFSADNIHNDERIRLTTTPDYSFTLFDKTYHIEADNAGGEYKGEPIKRKNIFGQQDIYKKCLGYLGAVKYGKARHRVLIVTRSHVRTVNIVEKLFPALYDKGGNEYRNPIFINYLDALKNDPLGSWCNIAGEGVHLLREK